MCKKALCLIFAFLFSINSFAAVVSDNDGSAFITKAEFDSLKNNFQTQLDAYNSSIDNKIDNAIASYLAGITKEAVSTSYLINSNWDECSAVNGAFANTYQLPNVDFKFLFQYYFKASDTNKSYDVADTGTHGAMSGEYEGNFGHFMNLKKTNTWNGSGQNNYRNLVNCTGNYNDFGDLIWAGRALKYQEDLVLTKVVSSWLGTTNNIGWLDYYDRPDSHSYGLTIRNVSTFKPSGYVSDWKNVANASWPLSYLWVWDGSNQKTISWTSGKENNAMQSAIELLADSTGKKIEYEHIISYRNNDAWRVSDTKFNKLFRQAPDNNNKSSTLYNAAGKTNTAKGFSCCWYRIYDSTGSNPRARSVFPVYYGQIPVSHSVTDDAILSSVGMLPNDVASGSIYQDNETRSITTNKATIIKGKPTLNQGFQLLVNKKDAKITWEPSFNYTEVHNSSDTYTINTHEVDLYFSLSPFTDKVARSGDLIKVKVNGSDKQDYATTVNRTCKIEFDMPDDGLVYVKWVPHESTYIDDDWIVTLDIKNSSTYTYQSEL